MAENSQNHGRDRFSDELSGALDWWRDAGVDADFSDDPIDRLAEADAERKAVETQSKPPAKTQPSQTGEIVEHSPAMLGGDQDLWPTNLEAFARWWMEESSLEAGGTGPRVAPRGPRGGQLMIVVSQPGPDDKDQLLEGRHGQLVQSFLRATGLDTAQVYYASALPRAVAMPDWRKLCAIGLGTLLAHHIAVAKPDRLLVLSRNILPLMGHDVAQGSHLLTSEHGMERDVPVLAAAGPEELLRSAQRRKRLWQDWLDWTAG